MNNQPTLLQPLIYTALLGHMTNHTLISLPAPMYIYEFTLDKEEDHQLSLIPSPYCEWIIGFNKNGKNATFCCAGSMSQLTKMTLPHHDFYLGIRFDDNICYVNKTASIHASSAGMRDQTFQYKPEKGSYEYALVQELCAATAFSQQVQCFLDFLKASKRICTIPDHIGHLFAQLKSSWGACTVSELSHSSGYTQRHISRMFAGQFGFGPKDYCKYIRFQKALSEIIEKPDRSNSEFIQNIGYSDQAHFQREFKLFLNMTPRQYIRLLKQAQESL